MQLTLILFVLLAQITIFGQKNTSSLSIDQIMQGEGFIGNISHNLLMASQQYTAE